MSISPGIHQNPSRLIELYAVLTRAEQKECRSWLAFRLKAKKREQYLKIYDALKGRKSLDHVCARLQIPLKEAKQSLRKPFEKLTQLVEEYLAWKHIHKNPGKRDLHLIQELSKRNQPQLFEKELHKVFRHLEAQSKRGKAYWSIRFELESLYRQHQLKYNSRKRNSLDSKKLHDVLQEKILLEYFQSAFILLNQPSLEIKYLELNPRTDLSAASSTAKFYQRFLQFLQASDLSGFNEIFSSLKKHSAQLHEDEVINLAFLLLNLLIRIANQKKDQASMSYLVEVFTWAIQRELIMLNKIIPASIFKNMITLYAQIGEEAKARAFFKKYQHLLPETEQIEAERYNEAFICFFEGQFQKALSILRMRKFDLAVYELNARVLMFDIHYELGNLGEFQDELKGFLNSLNQRKRLPSKLKQSAINHCKFLLFLLKHEPRTSPVYLREKLGSQPFALNMHVKWLKKKIDDLGS